MTQTAEASTASREMIVIIRPSFMKICNQDACRAALFNHLLYWIAQKAKGQEANLVKSGEISWFGNIEEDIHQGLAGAWGISKIKQELKALVSTGLIGQRRNPLKGWDRTYCYFIGEEQGKTIREACTQHGICIIHQIDLSSDVFSLLEKTNAMNECCCFIPLPERSQQHLLTRGEINTEKEKARLNTHIEDARKAGLSATLTLEEWLATLKAFNYQCAYCSGSYELLEHFVPVVLGGGTTYHNCVPSCYKCNSRKNTYHPFLIPTSVGLSREAIAHVADYCKNVEKRDHE